MIVILFSERYVFINENIEAISSRTWESTFHTNYTHMVALHWSLSNVENLLMFCEEISMLDIIEAVLL